MVILMVLQGIIAHWLLGSWKYLLILTGRESTHRLPCAKMHCSFSLEFPLLEVYSDWNSHDYCFPGMCGMPHMHFRRWVLYTGDFQKILFGDDYWELLSYSIIIAFFMISNLTSPKWKPHCLHVSKRNKTESQNLNRSKMSQIIVSKKELTKQLST